MTEQKINLPSGKKLYFASDFHLGVPDYETSRERERKIVSWLRSIRESAHAIYLLGDIFDFWFEYRHAIPKGFIRLQGTLAELRDAGIEVYFFTGNHDMWMFEYFPRELGIPIYREPIIIHVGDKKLLIGHGDGMGPGERGYKVLKAFFNSSTCQWLFARLHPNFGMTIAKYWSKKSRINNMKREEEFKGEENEFLYVWCREQEKTAHYDYYIFGHRHLSLDLTVGENSRYINLGEWVHHSNFASFDGSTLEVKSYQP